MSRTIHFRQQFFIICELNFLYSYSFHFFNFFGYAVTVSNFPNYLIMQLQFFLPELILHKYSVEGYFLPFYFDTFSLFSTIIVRQHTLVSAHLSLLFFQRSCALCPFFSCASAPDRDHFELTFPLGSRNSSFRIHRALELGFDDCGPHQSNRRMSSVATREARIDMLTARIDEIRDHLD